MPDEIVEGGQANLDLMAQRREGGPMDEMFATDFVDHDPGEGQPPGGGGLGWWWGQFMTSFSDVERTVLHTVATTEHVVTVMDLSGTYTGEWMGHAPTGKRFTVRNVQVMRIVDGKLTERWGSTDQLGILGQLGLG